MVKNIKARQRDRIIMEFGILIQPFDDLARKGSPPTKDEYAIAIAKVIAGIESWTKSVKEFTTFSNDIVFIDERRLICDVPEELRRWVRKAVNSPTGLLGLKGLHSHFISKLESSKAKFIEVLSSVPFEWEPVIFEANTPFTAHLRIREAVITTKSRFHYFDRYLRPEFFRLFVSELPRSIEIRIVTTAGNSSYGFKGVEDISNLVRQEYSDYKLIEVDYKLIHDRNLRIDDMIFTLGPGVDRAGAAVTNFGPSDNSNAAHLAIDQIIQNGTVRHAS